VDLTSSREIWVSRRSLPVGYVKQFWHKSGLCEGNGYLVSLDYARLQTMLAYDDCLATVGIVQIQRVFDAFVLR
jgi:hypothetical protein